MAKLENILKGLSYKSDRDISGVAINSITNNSNEVLKGGLFIAVPGHKADGHDFIGAAIKRHAKAIVAERDFTAPKSVVKIIMKDIKSSVSSMAVNFYGDPSKKFKIVGVTGTNGKTTITYIIENIFKEAKIKSGVIGTINYRIGNRKIPAINTTPGPLELQSLFHKMLENKVRNVVMEVSSHSLDQGRVDNVLFDVAIFTNITKEHLDYHKTIDRYFNAKAKLFNKLKQDAAAILNNDDRMVAGLAKRIKGKVITYGLNNRSDVMARDIKLYSDRTEFNIITPKGEFHVSTKLIGRHNVSNILASVATSIALNIPFSTIKKGIESFKSVPGRLELIDEGQPFKVFVDYAHTEDALCNVLGLLREVASDKNIITVFGCGGDRDNSKRPLMGRAACRLSDKVIVTSDNPRFEDPMDIISQIESGIRDEFSNYHVIEDRKSAIGKALSMALDDDIVIIAGKGHEKYQIIKDKISSFDDCSVVRTLLKKRARL